MPDATFSPLRNSEQETGVIRLDFKESQQSDYDDPNGVDDDAGRNTGNSTVLTASFNFINSIVGAGIIGIPYAMQQCGFVSGVLMLTSVAYLVYQSVTMLIDCGIKANKLDFEELAEHLLGKTGYYASLVFMFLFAYGAQVAYLVVIGDTIPVVAQLFLPESIFANRDYTIGLTSVFIILPLCLLRDLGSLSWTSMLSIGADVALVLIVLIAAPGASTSEGIKHNEITTLNSSIFIGIGTMSFAFVCQHNSFIVFRSLKEKTSENWGKVAKGSIFFSFLMCATLGIAGYLCFLEETKGDILNNFPTSGLAVSTARLLLAFCMVFTYPMECLVTRHCFLSIIQRVVNDRNGNQGGEKNSGGRNNRQNIQNGNFEERNPMLTNANCADNNDHNGDVLERSSNEQKNNGSDDFEIEESDVIYFNDLGISKVRDPRSVEKSEIRNNRREKIEKTERRKRENDKGTDKCGDEGEKESEGTVCGEFATVDLLSNGRKELNDVDNDLHSEDLNGAGKNDWTRVDDTDREFHHGKIEKARSENVKEKRRNKEGREIEEEETKRFGSDNDDLCSDASSRSFNSFGTTITLNSTINEKSEIEEGRRKKNSAEIFGLLQPIKMKMNDSGKFDSKKEERIEVEIMRQKLDAINIENSHFTYGSKDFHYRDVYDDSTSIDIDITTPNSFNNNGTKIKNDDTNDNNKRNSQYGAYHPISLLNKVMITEDKTSYDFVTKFLCCFSSSSSSQSFSSCPIKCRKITLPDKENSFRIFITLVLWGSSVVIALIFRDLGMVLAFTGAVAASMLGYVLPGVLYLQTYKIEAKEAWMDIFSRECCDCNFTNSSVIIDAKTNHVDKISTKSDNSVNDNTTKDGDCDIENIGDNNRNRDNNCNVDIDNNMNTSSGSESSRQSYTALTAETKSLISGRKRKTMAQKVRVLSRFFMPVFMIFFGICSMVIGVTSVFLF